MTQPGTDRQDLITPATQRLLSSTYWTQFGQYGIPHPSVWRGAVVCTDPPPPASGNIDSTSQAVVKLVQALIDDDKLPDPDDGPRIIHVVVMPNTFTVTDQFVGDHRSYDKSFPFGGDRFWAGWVEFDPDVNQTIRVITHEIAETLVDPENNGWRWSPLVPGDIRTEFCDGSEGQNAFVNDVMVQAHWSDRHNAPIIPIDGDYAAQLDVRVKEIHREEVDSGRFVPPNNFCRPEHPECCFDGMDYSWRTYQMVEVARIGLNLKRFRQPNVRWFIEGQPAIVGAPHPVTAELETYSGLTATITPTPITLTCEIQVNPPRLKITPNSVHGNFAVTVSCEVTDDSITGNPLVNVMATPHVAVGFRGEETLLPDDYIEKLGRCLHAMLERYVDVYNPTGVSGPDEGVNWVSELVTRGLPAYVRPTQFEQVATLERVVRATNALFGGQATQQQMRDLMELVPTLGAAARYMPETVPFRNEAGAA